MLNIYIIYQYWNPLSSLFLHSIRQKKKKKKGLSQWHEWASQGKLKLLMWIVAQNTKTSHFCTWMSASQQPVPGLHIEAELTVDPPLTVTPSQKETKLTALGNTQHCPSFLDIVFIYITKWTVSIKNYWAYWRDRVYINIIRKKPRKYIIPFLVAQMVKNLPGV